MKKTNKKRRILAIGLIIVMAVLLAACGSSKKKNSDVVKEIEKKWKKEGSNFSGESKIEISVTADHEVRQIITGTMESYDENNDHSKMTLEQYRDGEQFGNMSFESYTVEDDGETLVYSNSGDGWTVSDDDDDDDDDNDDLELIISDLRKAEKEDDGDGYIFTLDASDSKYVESEILETFIDEEAEVKKGEVIIKINKNLYPESIEFKNIKGTFENKNVEMDFIFKGKVKYDDFGKIDEDDVKPSSSIVKKAKEAE